MSWLLLLPLLASLRQAPNTEDRSFYMGFTPFPYDFSMEAVQYSYDRLKVDADMVSMHLDNGVPWPEALAGTSFQTNALDEWQMAKSRIPQGHKIYVSISPINLMRDGLALYRGEKGDMPLPGNWASYKFNSPEVRKAFLNYAIYAVRFWHPDFLNIGIEANLLKRKSPGKWRDYVELQKETYAALKEKYPRLPVFASVTGPDMLAGYTETDTKTQLEALADVEKYSDICAISVYPYMTSSLGKYPPEMLDRLFELARGKPFAIAETGFIAQDLKLSSGITIPTTPEMQQAYVKDLMKHAWKDHYIFVNYFVIRDYDALAKKVPDSDLIRLWRDTGMYDEDGQPRPALAVWRAVLAKQYRR